MALTDTAAGDWSRLWTSPAMLALRHDRRDFFTIAWGVFAVAFFALLGFAAFAPEIIAKRPVPGLSIGLILALTYVATVMSLGAWYVRRARHWDTLAAAVLSTPTAPLEQEVTGNV
ncbi:DUF485 domain-containing protein [Rhodococcus sp. T2V]|uniref:DUF485 domain-containing protein n=1 Tax=Rhodococcus sp. T2V TaxID=3034164 RepID=UPI0023E26D66|nr:DUF485 domain-containing protein [Rhodococcus sp. T2V]MDF3306444.1 DUF485 domain-containing protein [Rhodococcus sp. T2V]